MPFLLLFLIQLSYAQWCQFTDGVSFPEAETVIAVYGHGSEKEVKIAFDFKKPVVLILFNVAPVKWNIVGNDTKILAVVTYGIHEGKIVSLPGSLPVLENSIEKGGPCVQKSNLEHPKYSKHFPLPFQVAVQMRIKQLAMRLFPRKKIVYYHSPDFQNLRRVRSY